MTKRVRRSADGLYHVMGKAYKQLVGKRQQVWHGTAYKTPGGLTKEKLFMNKRGRIVSAVKHKTARKEKRLEKHGYYAEKGKFGMVRKDGTRRKKKSGSRRARGKGGWW